jgi:hypothetical protein
MIERDVEKKRQLGGLNGCNLYSFHSSPSFGLAIIITMKKLIWLMLVAFVFASLPIGGTAFACQGQGKHGHKHHHHKKR